MARWGRRRPIRVRTLRGAFDGVSGATVSPGLISQVGVIFDPTVLRAALVTPGLIDQSGATFAPEIRPAQVVTPGLIDQSGVTFSPTVTVSGGPQSITPGLINQTGALFAPQANQQVQAPLISLDLYGEFFGQGYYIFAPTVSIPAASVVNAPLISQTGVVFTPEIRPEQLVEPGLISQAGVTFAPVVNLAGAAQSVVPGLISSSGVTFAPTVNESVSPGLISQVGVLFVPQLNQAAVIPLISQAGSLFTPFIGAGVFGTPVRDPQAKLIGVEALAALVDAEGKAVLI